MINFDQLLVDYWIKISLPAAELPPWLAFTNSIRAPILVSSYHHMVIMQYAPHPTASFSSQFRFDLGICLKLRFVHPMYPYYAPTNVQYLKSPSTQPHAAYADSWAVFQSTCAFLNILMQVSILDCQTPCKVLPSQRFLHQCYETIVGQRLPHLFKNHDLIMSGLK